MSKLPTNSGVPPWTLVLASEGLAQKPHIRTVTDMGARMVAAPSYSCSRQGLHRSTSLPSRRLAVGRNDQHLVVLKGRGPREVALPLNIPGQRDC
jgi:hypothetical protein